MGSQEKAEDQASSVTEEPLDIEAQANGFNGLEPTSPMGKVGELNDLVQLQEAQQCEIAYSNLTYSVKIKEKGSKQLVTKEILKGVHGVIRPGRLTAVMGASGAGKTTFLNMLAGFQKANAIVSGEIRVNGEVVEGSKMRRFSGFVHQEDVILDTQTVREALMFAAELKLPNSMSHADKEKRAMDVAELLSLRKSLDNLVGSALIKGISGGEKRRLSLAQAMITNPSILFLDEPTSGLDSYTAYKVARILRSVAHRYGRTIVTTIHQPSSEVFSLFDDLIVLGEGQVMYHGPVEDMVPYFAALGYQCPHHYNPADFLFMEVLHAGSSGDDEDYDFVSGGPQGDEASKQQAREREAARVQAIIEAWQKSENNATLHKTLSRRLTMGHGVHESVIQSHATFFTQFRLIAGRALKNMWRNQLILRGKAAQTVFLSLVVGLIFLQVGDDPQGVQDRQGSLFFIVVQGLFGSVMGTLTVFGTEKAVFQREFSSRYFGLPAYFIGRTIVTFPPNILLPLLSSSIMYWMVGYQNSAEKFWWFALILVLMDNCGAACGLFVACIFNDIAMALTVMPMFLLPLMVFSGFFVNSQTLGWWFRWISYISPMKYGFIALIKNEFTGLWINCDPNSSGCNAQGQYPGTDTIELLGFSDSGSVGQNAGILFALMWGFMFLAYIALWAAVRRTSF